MWKNLQSECFSIFVCLSFSSFCLFFCQYALFRQFLQVICSEKYMPVLNISFFKALCRNFIFSPENAFNSGITTDCSFFNIKLIWLNPKSALNLIVFGSDNLDCIITETKIFSWTEIYTDFILSNLLFCKITHVFNPQFPLISLSIRS